VQHQNDALELKARLLTVPTLQVLQAFPLPSRPPLAPCHESWIRTNLCAVGNDTKKLPLRASQHFFSKGSRHDRIIGPLLQLQMWASFWADEKVEARYLDGRGLGVFCVASLYHNRLVARSVMDCDVWHERMRLLTWHVRGKATAFGPLSLINAGCERCSNVHFRLDPHEKNVWCARICTSRVAAGRELLAHYDDSLVFDATNVCRECGRARQKPGAAR